MKFSNASDRAVVDGDLVTFLGLALAFDGAVDFDLTSSEDNLAFRITYVICSVDVDGLAAETDAEIPLFGLIRWA